MQPLRSDEEESEIAALEDGLTPLSLFIRQIVAEGVPRLDAAVTINALVLVSMITDTTLRLIGRSWKRICPALYPGWRAITLIRES